RSGEVLNIEDAYDDPRFNKEVDQRTGYRTKSVLCMPLRNKDGKTIGVTQIINKHGGPFNKEDEELLSAFSAQAAIALENSMLFEETLEVRNYLECILQSINQLVLTLDTGGKLVRSNRPVGPLLGIDETRMTQSCYKQWFGESNSTLIENIERVYHDPKAIYVADDDLQAGDRIISFNYNIVPLLDFEGKQDGVVVVMEDITDQKRVMTTLGRYMSPIVAQKVLDEGGDRLGGIRQEVAVLFSDIRGYTAITESMDAQHVVELLNSYFSLMVDAVFAENGLLDKYIGDALMAVFGVPFPQEDDSIRACRAALKMRTALIEFNEIQKQQGRLPVGIGIGINSGEVISGNIGSERRLEYTCIGDGVNLASRIEGVSKHYGVTIVMSEYTQRKIGDQFVTRELDTIRVLGKQHPIRIFELIGTTDDEIAPVFLQSLSHYHAGLEAYRNAQWSTACEHFQHAHQLGHDNPSAILLQRSRAMMQTPPPEHWDGIWDMTGK
ncbi:MAG: GAF domain-containing protein, partial [Planctomycetaceae bacterium]|nr:GAF domain-containing protein [Planctomycetaceae bacterium]